MLVTGSLRFSVVDNYDICRTIVKTPNHSPRGSASDAIEDFRENKKDRPLSNPNYFSAINNSASQQTQHMSRMFPSFQSIIAAVASITVEQCGAESS